ncbi:hypothetical protein ThidrDRAFT_1239 [Thiorhodococcus drewsii AZ1]|uniref:Uncharacterized protein n=1 Tax=Thiorhodococcus drewsii AZ1 TaxID=765913 RepID=G2DZ36_9GAMM|nr:hypothetical protein ThidrDRAFT_1239 [Thiorhodococcus drewsii AZ1]
MVLASAIRESGLTRVKLFGSNRLEVRCVYVM